MSRHASARTGPQRTRTLSLHMPAVSTTERQSVKFKGEHKVDLRCSLMLVRLIGTSVIRCSIVQSFTPLLSFATNSSLYLEDRSVRRPLSWTEKRLCRHTNTHAQLRSLFRVLSRALHDQDSPLFHLDAFRVLLISIQRPPRPFQQSRRRRLQL